MRVTVSVSLIVLGIVAMGLFSWFSGRKEPRKVVEERQPLSDEQLKALSTEALITELNQPLLEPLQNPSQDFVSKLNFETTDLSERLRKIDWFSRCGQPVTVKVSMAIHKVSGWPEAVALCNSDPWSNTELEAQNQLTIWLSRAHKGEYRKWNDLVRQHKSSTLGPIVEPAVLAACKTRSVDESVLPCVQWDVLGAMMESSYLNTGHKAFFFLELLTIYESGHFPCGWEGEWPDGRLCVW